MPSYRAQDDPTGDGETHGAPLTVKALTGAPAIFFGANPGPALYFCTGTPLNAIIAAVGSLALRSDGGANTTLYVKEANGTLSTGWVAK